MQGKDPIEIELNAGREAGTEPHVRLRGAVQAVGQAGAVHDVAGTGVCAKLAVRRGGDIGDEVGKIFDGKAPGITRMDGKVRRPIDFVDCPVVGRLQIGLDRLGGVGQTIAHQCGRGPIVHVIEIGAEVHVVCLGEFTGRPTQPIDLPGYIRSAVVRRGTAGRELRTAAALGRAEVCGGEIPSRGQDELIETPTIFTHPHVDHVRARAGDLELRNSLTIPPVIVPIPLVVGTGSPDTVRRGTISVEAHMARVIAAARP